MIPRAAFEGEYDAERMELEVEGRRLLLTNLDKVLWPEAGFTKGGMLGYYSRIAPALVPHVSGRPLTLARFPDGVEGRGWYQSNCRGHPEWVATRTIVGKAGQQLRLCVVNDLPSLLWVANFGAVELHPFLAHGDRPDEPSAVVFDLDPGPPAGLMDCCAVALWLRRLLDDVGLASSPKTSGSIGLHVYVPLGGGHTFAQTKEFARRVAATLAEEHPEAVVDAQRRILRPGRVLIDWLQNDPTRSTVAPYSLRASRVPAVSTPLSWDEVERVVASRRAESLRFDPAAVLERFEREGDLFRQVLEVAQALPG